MKSLLEDHLDREIEIFIDKDNYSLDDENKEILNFENYAGLKKRLEYYKKWCLKNKENIGFDFIIYKKNKDDFIILVRRAYLEINKNKLKLKFHKAVPISESAFGKSLRMLDFTNDAVLVSDAEPIDDPGPRVIYANKAFENVSGYSIKEILGKSPRLMQGDDTSEKARQNIREALTNWDSINQEIKNYTKKKEPFYTELNINPVSDETGWWTHWVSYQKNITKEKIETNSFDKIQEIAKVGCWSLNIETQQTIWSSEVYKIHKLKEGTPTNKIDGISFYAPSEREKIARYVERCITHHESFDDVFEFYDSDGIQKWVRSCGEPLIQNDGAVIEIFGTFQDVTSSYKEKEALQKIVDYTPDVIFRLNKEGIFTYVSNAWERLLGHKPQDVVGKHFKDFVHNDDILVCQNELTKLYELKENRTIVEYRVFNKEGKIRFHRTHGILFDENELIFQGIASDITEEKKLKEDLKSILNETSIGVWQWNIKDNILDWDESMYKLYNLDKDLFSGDYDAWESSLHPEDKQRASEEINLALRGEKSFDTSFRIISGDNSIKHIKARAHITKDKDGNPSVMRGINLDKTNEFLLEEKKQEEQKKIIIQSRLASMGELAAGVGHEINNPLAIAMGNIERILDSKNSWDEIINTVNVIKDAHVRIQNITDGLRNFSRNDKENEVFNLVGTLKESLNFVKNVYNANGIEVIFENHNGKDAFVNGKRAEILQVIMNLISNAKDATEGKEERKIIILLEKNKDHAIIKITDNGFGIPKENQEKIFDSFFTSKEVGKGTGIGLSMVNQIISDHKGEIKFETTLNIGTTFIVSLPLTSDKEDSSEKNDNEKNEIRLIQTGLNILIAEDEEGIRDIFEYMFYKEECQIDFAANGKIALDMYKNNNYDIVISDMQMPEMSGPELLKNIKSYTGKNDPKFLFITGGVRLSDEVKQLLKICDGLIKKPFKKNDVIASINNIFLKESKSDAE